MENEQEKPVDNPSNSSPPSQTVLLDNSQSLSDPLKVKTDPDSDTELSNSPKKQKKNEEITSTNNNQSKNPTHTHYRDISFHEKDIGYCSFSTTNKKSSEPNTKPESTQSNPVQEILNQVSTHTADLDSEEDEQKKKIAAAKKLMFPDALATSFTEVVDTLRNERRQEFCPIYKDETAEQIALRQAKQKPVGSLLAKRIRWDDLKRKREDEQRKAQMQYHYGPYGPIYTNQQSSQQSFANPYEQYYATMHNQYEQMLHMTRAQQEHSGFWPEYHQSSSSSSSSLQNNDQIAQNSMQQVQPYTYPYPATYANNMTGMNTNIQSSYTSADYDLYLNSIRQPPPPPPDEPYPY